MVTNEHDEQALFTQALRQGEGFAIGILKSEIRSLPAKITDGGIEKHGFVLLAEASQVELGGASLSWVLRSKSVES